MTSRNGEPPASPTASVHSFLTEDPYHSGSPRSLSRMASLPAHLAGTDGTGDDAHLTQSSLLNRLESLLRAKAEEVQLAGQLGQALLSQQQELEGRIRDIAEVAARFADRQSSSSAGRGGESSDGSEAREVGEETKKSLRALEEELERWENGNQDLYQVVGTAAARGVPALNEVDPSTGSAPSARPRAPSLSLGKRPSMADLAASTSNTSIASAASSTTPALDASSSRRARNTAQHRTNDIELATEIGQSLLVEVRRLQALLQEKEEHVRAVERERDGMAQEVEQAMAQKKQVEDASGASLPLRCLSPDTSAVD